MTALAEGRTWRSAMAWRLDGTYFENCSCEVVCPCTAADFAAPADHERCRVLIAFHVDPARSTALTSAA